MVAVCQRDAAKVNTFGLYNAFGIRRLSQRCYIELTLTHIKIYRAPEGAL